MTSHLKPDRHQQRDFFVADLCDVAAKDDLASMEHPLFALKAGDHRERRYEHNGMTVKVQPGFLGLATIHDKDVWIYCISQLVEAMNRGREDVSRTVQFTAYDFLRATNRPTAGVGYQRLDEALNRLRGTTIETNIKTDSYRESRGFGLIDAWKVVERGPGNRMVAIEVTLPDWLYRSVMSKQVLTLSRDYFRIRKPLDRRIYELARKHCGRQPKWCVSLAILHHKSGSTASLRRFRQSVRELAASDELPDYSLTFDVERDMATFHSRSSRGQRKRLNDLFA